MKKITEVCKPCGKIGKVVTKASKVKNTKRHSKHKRKKFVPRENAALIELVRNNSGRRIGILAGVLIGGEVYVHGSKCHRTQDRFNYQKGVQIAIDRAHRFAKEIIVAEMLEENSATECGTLLPASLEKHVDQFAVRCVRFFGHNPDLDIHVPRIQEFSSKVRASAPVSA